MMKRLIFLVAMYSVQDNINVFQWPRENLESTISWNIQTICQIIVYNKLSQLFTRREMLVHEAQS